MIKYNFFIEDVLSNLKIIICELEERKNIDGYIHYLDDLNKDDLTNKIKDYVYINSIYFFKYILLRKIDIPLDYMYKELFHKKSKTIKTQEELLYLYNYNKELFKKYDKTGFYNKKEKEELKEELRKELLSEMNIDMYHLNVNKKRIKPYQDNV